MSRLRLLLSLTTPDQCCYRKQRKGRAADARALSSQSPRFREDRDLEGAAAGAFEHASLVPYRFTDVDSLQSDFWAEVKKCRRGK